MPKQTGPKPTTRTDTKRTIKTAAKSGSKSHSKSQKLVSTKPVVVQSELLGPVAVPPMPPMPPMPPVHVAQIAPSVLPSYDQMMESEINNAEMPRLPPFASLMRLPDGPVPSPAAPRSYNPRAVSAYQPSWVFPNRW